MRTCVFINRLSTSVSFVFDLGLPLCTKELRRLIVHGAVVVDRPEKKRP